MDSETKRYISDLRRQAEILRSMASGNDQLHHLLCDANYIEQKAKRMEISYRINESVPELLDIVRTLERFLRNSFPEGPENSPCVELMLGVELWKRCRRVLGKIDGNEQETVTVKENVL